MEITDNTNLTVSAFSVVTEGDAFVSDSIAYLRTADFTEGNAVGMADGALASFEDTDLVSVPTANLTLTN